jgi:cysteine-rich secretory family protein
MLATAPGEATGREESQGGLLAGPGSRREWRPRGAAGARVRHQEIGTLFDFSTRMSKGMMQFVWAGTLGVLMASWAGAARAEEPAKTAEKEAAQPAAAAPRKQWVWLKSQELWGYGYQRSDGLWVIDPGSKRKAAPVDPNAEPTGFLSWLNSTRAAFGLPAVGHDPNLSSWAAVNNAQQQARGMGHHVMGPARRQNCAMGPGSNIGSMWMNSPAHRAALLDPSIRWIGIAGMGAYWTFNAY